jgi:hypothetical protein
MVAGDEAAGWQLNTGEGGHEVLTRSDMQASTSRTALVALLLAACTACSTLPSAACRPGQQAAVQELVYFGTRTPTGGVSREDWADFLATAVTPRFPAGLTTWEVSGQWRSDNGGLVHEPSYVLSLVHPPDARSEAALGEVVDAYKQRFAQEAVLRVRSPACMSL